MTVKNIDSEFLEPILDIDMRDMGVAPFKEVSLRLDFQCQMLMEEDAYKLFIELPGETDVPASTLAVRWNNVLMEIVAMRINGMLIVPAEITVQVEGTDGVMRDARGDLYIDDEDDGKPRVIVTTPKTRGDFLNGTRQ